MSNRIQTLLEGAFPEQAHTPRWLGAEDEFAVVDVSGRMVDITPLFHLLVADKYTPKYDAVTHALIGVHGDGQLEIGMDVGLGTLEIGWPPVDNLFTHIEEREHVLRIVDAHLATLGFKRLKDYACQPLTVPNRDTWAHKGRANVFRDLFNPNVHNQTLSMSAQMHVDVTRDEVIPALEMYLSLAPVFVALNANSPVWGGALDPEGMLAARQDFWYRFTRAHGYSANVLCGRENGDMHEQTPQSFEELALFMGAAKFLVHVQNGCVENPNVPFTAWVAAQNGPMSDTAFRDAFENHEGTLWWDARPRIPYGTIEVRPMCQNVDAWASHALVLGLIEHLAATLAFIHQIGSYQDWRARQKDALQNGLRASGMQEIAMHVINLAHVGLRHRGLNEGILLEPLERRVRDATSPGHLKLQVFEIGGMPALLELLMHP